MVQNIKTVRADLTPSEAQKFKKLKEKIGTTQNSETLRVIINNAYDAEFGEEDP